MSFKGTHKVYLITGESMHNFLGVTVRRVAELLLDIPQDIAYGFNLSSKYLHGAKDSWEIIQRKTGVTVPKMLRVFNAEDMYHLICSLKNTGELNTICQYLSANKFDGGPIIDRDPLGRRALIKTPSLWAVLSRLINKTPLYDQKELFSNTLFEEDPIAFVNWQMLLRDYVSDCFVLKKRMFSLKMTSLTRIQDEHRKMSIIRRAKAMPAIKVNEEYKAVETKLKEELKIVTDLEMITEKKRLLQEGVEQEHCVASYGNHINSGHCTILSLVYNEERYTCEIKRINTNVFSGSIGFAMTQCRGKRNKDAPTELKSAIHGILSQIVSSSLKYA